MPRTFERRSEKVVPTAAKGQEEPATAQNGASGGTATVPLDNNRQRWLRGQGTSTSLSRSAPIRWERSPRFSRRQIGLLVVQVLIVIVALLAWQWFGSGKTEKLTVSQPTEVWKWLSEWARGQKAHGWSDLWVTLKEAVEGWVLGIVIGVALAVLLATSRWIKLFAAPFVSVLNALPKIALAPLFILILGANTESKVYFVTAGIFFIVFYNVFGGIRSIDVVLLRNARVLGASRLWLIRDVYAPAIVGWVMIGLRLTAAWALTSAVIIEYLGAQKGMGYIVSEGQQTYDPAEVLAGVLIIAVVALLIDRVIVRVERRFSRWRLT
jgi:NitT/TauT family transport system permease protein